MRSPDEQEDFLNRGRFEEKTEASLPQRVLFAFLGLLAGDAVLLLWLLRGMAGAGGVFVLYGAFSFVGWLIIGLPVALGVSPAVLCGLFWPWRLLIGIFLGPLSLLAIFVILAARGGTLNALSPAHTGVLWPMSMLVSGTSFFVYTGLLRRYAVAK